MPLRKFGAAIGKLHPVLISNSQYLTKTDTTIDLIALISLPALAFIGQILKETNLQACYKFAIDLYLLELPKIGNQTSVFGS